MRALTDRLCGILFRVPLCCLRNPPTRWLQPFGAVARFSSQWHSFTGNISASSKSLCFFSLSCKIATETRERRCKINACRKWAELRFVCFGNNHGVIGVDKV